MITVPRLLHRIDTWQLDTGCIALLGGKSQYVSAKLGILLSATRLIVESPAKNAIFV